MAVHHCAGIIFETQRYKCTESWLRRCVHWFNLDGAFKSDMVLKTNTSQGALARREQVTRQARMY